MPAPSKRPSPPARMVALLTEEKRRLIAANGHVTLRDFDQVWERCWDIMKREHAYPHLTPERRGWRQAQVLGLRPECRAAFLGTSTAFSRVVGRLREAAAQQCLTLTPEQTTQALLAATAFIEVPDLDAARRISDATADAFESMPDDDESPAARPSLALSSLAQ